MRASDNTVHSNMALTSNLSSEVGTQDTPLQITVVLKHQIDVQDIPHPHVHSSARTIYITDPLRSIKIKISINGGHLRPNFYI